MPLLVAPAMNREMWAHPATQRNLVQIAQDGAQVLGVGHGEQACGEVGEGRMREPAALVADLAATIGPRRLAGHRVLVSAGPTFEDIDPVRFLGNRSSGRMGFAVAEAAAAAGAEVTLVAGPYRSSSLRPGGAVNRTVRVTSPAASGVGGRGVRSSIPVTSSRCATGRTSRCAADSTTTRSSPGWSPTTTAPEGSARSRASVVSSSVAGS